MKLPEQFDIDYALIFNAASNGMAFSEFDTGRILDVNAAWVAATGIERQDCIGRTALELGVWARAEDRRECVAQVQRDGGVRDFAADLVVRGRPVPHLISAQRVRTAATDCMLWEFRDVGESRRAEQAIRASELKYRTLADKLPLAIQVFAPDGATRWVNKTWERMWHADLALLAHYNVLRDEQLGELGIRPLLLRAFAGEAVEFPVHRYDRARVQEVGSPEGALFVRAFAYPVPGEDGRPLEVVVVQEDVTEQVTAEEQLRRYGEEQANLAKRYETLLQGASDVVLVTDAAGRIVDLNDAACAAYGYAPAEMRELTLGDLCAEQDDATRERRWDAAGEGAGVRFEAVHRHRNGSTFPVEVSARQLEIAGVPYTQSFVRDITERKRVESRLIAATDAAAAAARAKSQFLANMSHEIRTPLNAVIGFSQLLEAGVEPAEYGEIAANIGIAGRTLLDIVNEILDFSKIEAGRLQIERRPFDLADIVGRLDRMFRQVAQGKGVRLRFETTTGNLPRFLGDVLRIEQVLTNLVANAIKFTARGEVVLAIAAEPDGEASTRLRFEVRDTGIGIATEALPQLFTPFSQADTGITRRFGGTGLGLAISKRLVEAMGGTIGVASTLGSGSRFWFELSLEHADVDGSAAGSAAGRDPSLPRQPLAGVRVLVVDDNRLSREVVERLLVHEGAVVTLVEDGRRALDVLAVNPSAFDAVLMDIQMPVMDGLVATRAIRAQPGLARLPVFALSAGVLATERAAALDAGADGFFAKPISVHELVEVLSSRVPRR